MDMNGSQIVFGTCDGTGAAINVCLGFIPSYVKVWNVEDAGTLHPQLEWLRDMSVITAFAQGVKLMGLSDTDMDRVLLTTTGIAAYNGGDEIVYDGVTSKRWEAVSATFAGASKEEVYVNGHYRRTAVGDAAYECVGYAIAGTTSPRHGTKVKTTEGFTIGADTDINADGEQLLWMAIR
jgi:hypothetical protein